MAYIPKLFNEYLTNIISYLVARNSKLSNWKEGSRLRTLSEAVALELSKQGYEFYNGMTDAIRQSCYNSFGFELLPAEKAVGFVRVVKTGHTETFLVPIFQITTFGVTYQSTIETSIPVWQTFVDVDIVAVNTGSNYNVDALVLDTDQETDIDIELDYDRIYNPVAIQGGTDGETEFERSERFQDFIRSLSRSTLDGISYGVSTVQGVKDFLVTENVDPYSGYDSPGWINVYLSDGTNLIDPVVVQAVKDKINGVLGDPNNTGYRAAGTRLFVGTIQIVPVNITYSMQVYETSEITDDQYEVFASAEIGRYINSLFNGQDVILDTVRSFALLSATDIHRVIIETPSSDIAIQHGHVARVGGALGGTITLSGIERITKQ